MARLTKVHRVARTPPAGLPQGKQLTLCGTLVDVLRDTAHLTTAPVLVTCKTCIRSAQGPRGQERVV